MTPFRTVTLILFASLVQECIVVNHVFTLAEFSFFGDIEKSGPKCPSACAYVDFISVFLSMKGLVR